jgi:hypothetical protein
MTQAVGLEAIVEKVGRFRFFQDLVWLLAACFETITT